jgi:hypothetical protein
MVVLGVIGGLVYFVAWIWLIVVAFRSAGAVWGIINIFVQPITGVIFCVIKKTGWLQLGLMILGLVLLTVGFMPNAMRFIERFK